MRATGIGENTPKERNMISDCHSQDESFTIKGYWWLPGSDRKIAGDVIYDVGNLTLELYGGLNDARTDNPFGAKPAYTEFSIILGESLDRVPITLLDSFYTKWTPDIRTLATPPGTTVALLSSELTCSAMIYGGHLSSPDEPFISCQVEMPDLDVWLGDPQLTTVTEGPDRHFQIAWPQSHDEEFQVDEFEYSIRFCQQVQQLGGNPLTIERRTHIGIIASKPKSLSWFREHDSEITDLFSFLYGDCIQSLRVVLKTGGTDADEVALYYPRPKMKPAKYRPIDMLVRYGDVKHLFAGILNNWVTASEDAKIARRIVLSGEQRPSSFIELRFLPLIHALECLVKEMDHSTIVAPDVFKNAVGSMLASLPNDLPVEVVDSIKSSLGWANGRNLKGKLKRMLDEYQDATCQLFCISKEMFIKGIVNTRNYYTHYSPQKKLLRDAELHWAIRKTSLMLRIILLLKAGVPEDILQRLVNCHHRLRGDRAVWSTITEEGSAFADTDDD
jgi:hypothetical protein